MKCKRCSYLWLMMGTREIKGTLYWVDLGICKCGNATSRVGKAGPGEQVNAELWGQRFKVVKREAE